MTLILWSLGLAPAGAAPGDLDPTFDGDGIARTKTDDPNAADPPATASSGAHGVAVQADGKIVAAGDARDANDNLVFGVVRYDRDGSLDTSFGVDGIVRTQVADLNATTPASLAFGLAVQADGKIVAAGNAVDANNRDVFGLVQYNPDGSLDTSFGSDGIVRTQAAHPEATGPFSGARAVAVQSDGRIVAVGVTVGARNNNVFGVVRYMPDGSLDTSFGVDGIVRTQPGDPVSQSSIALGVAVQGDGKIVAAGQTLDANFNSVFGVVRYMPDGSLDTSFGGDGIVRTQAADPNDTGLFSLARGVAVQADGKIVAAGEARDANFNSVFGVVRYMPDGSLDTSFGGDGIVRTQAAAPNATQISRVLGVAVQADGKIVAAGEARDANFSQVFGVVRYMPDGSLDTSFGSDGIVRAQAAAPNAIAQSRAFAIAVQADGKIVAAGAARDATNNQVFGVVRYLCCPVVVADADGFLRTGAKNRNEGANPFLRVNRAEKQAAVVSFDLSQLDPATVDDARLVLTIANNANNWGRHGDRSIHPHPLHVDFTEGNGINSIVPKADRFRGDGAGVTWSCASDDNIANRAADCQPRWSGGDFGPDGDEAVILNGQTGEVSWDVTDDVRDGVDGWLLGRDGGGRSGRVDFYSKDHADVATNPHLAPRLVITGG